MNFSSIKRVYLDTKSVMLEEKKRATLASGLNRTFFSSIFATFIVLLGVVFQLGPQTFLPSLLVALTFNSVTIAVFSVTVLISYLAGRLVGGKASFSECFGLCSIAFSYFFMPYLFTMFFLFYSRTLFAYPPFMWGLGYQLFGTFLDLLTIVLFFAYAYAFIRANQVAFDFSFKKSAIVSFGSTLILVFIMLIVLLLPFTDRFPEPRNTAMDVLPDLIERVYQKGFGLEIKESVVFRQGTIYRNDAVGNSPVSGGDVEFVCVGGDGSACGNSSSNPVTVSPTSIIVNSEATLTVVACNSESENKYFVVLGSKLLETRSEAERICELA